MTAADDDPTRAVPPPAPWTVTLPGDDRQLRFEVADPEGHAELLYDWMHEPHVAPWWGADRDLDQTVAYVRRQLDSGHLVPWIVSSSAPRSSASVEASAADRPGRGTSETAHLGPGTGETAHLGPGTGETAHLGRGTGETAHLGPGAGEAAGLGTGTGEAARLGTGGLSTSGAEAVGDDAGGWTPFGYTELYRPAEDPLADHFPLGAADRGWHVFVGPPEVLGSGLPRLLGRAVLARLLSEPGVDRVVCEPNELNGRMLAFCRALGYETVATLDLADKRAALMACTVAAFDARWPGDRKAVS